MPQVSVIVPNYNHSLYLKKRIDSILNQSYNDFELILLDDCSTDNSRDILLSYKDNPKVSRIILNEENSGSPFKQWNKGIELAQGEYVWIAESDDWAEENLLEVFIDIFEKRPNVGLIFCSSKLIDPHGAVFYENSDSNSGTMIEYSGNEFIQKKMLSSNSIWNASMMMFKKEAYPNVEKQSLYSNMKYCGDWFFYVLLAENIDVLEVQLTLNNFRVHTENVSTQAEQSGYTFFEGLDIYKYLKNGIDLKTRFKSSFHWGKNYYKSKRKYHYNKSINSLITKKMRKEHFLVLCDYLFYEFIRFIKKK